MKKNKIKIKDAIQILNPLEDAKDSVSTTVKLIVSALSLVAALAWNEAIKGLFDLLKQSDVFKGLGFLAPFLYAILVTILTIVIINKVQKFENKIVKKETKKLIDSK